MKLIKSYIVTYKKYKIIKKLEDVKHATKQFENYSTI